MKKTSIIIIGILILAFVSCEDPKKDEDTPLEHQTEELIHKIKDGDLEILEIDGCEYLIYKEHLSSNQGFGYMSHKGNCKNPIHCRNQNIESDSLSMELNKQK